MAEYQVLARKYRPQTFAEVVGQEAIVTTLRNAIKMKRLAHAYLFCGARGTGKTTLARLFAKALNCLQPTQEGEPCNSCASCKEITAGNSLDVLEIDGASHRGIDEVRQINETVGYATSTGGYKIYIIDEVHMLTKEAFNALLKTLEEPPPHAKFFFATTEPHKVLPTILSRCQRFTLSRISTQKIIEKLSSICQDIGVEIEEEALTLVATLADGGLRDAESLLDQIHSFQEGKITLEAVNAILGRVSSDCFFELDRAGKEGNLAKAFELSHELFTQGKDLVHFVESLTEHFRNLLMVKLSGKSAPFLSLSAAERDQYELSAKLYTQEQCLTLLDFLSEAEQQIRFATTGRVALEAILLRILRSHQRLPVEYLVRRLTELEQAIAGGETTAPTAPPPNRPQPLQPKEPPKDSSVSIDPTPTASDLGKREKSVPTKPLQPEAPKIGTPTKPLQHEAPKMGTPTKPLQPEAPKMGNSESRLSTPENQRRHDTLLQFAAVELEGTIQKNSNRDFR